MNDTPPMRTASTVTRSPGFILALFLLLLNDHLLKNLLPGLLTGKLSDVAGVFLVGLLACALPRVRPPLSLALLALLFIWWKSPTSSTAISLWNGLALWPVQRVEDYSDLIALLSLPAAHAYWQRYRAIALSRLLRLPLIMATVFAVSATSMIPRTITLQVPTAPHTHTTARAADVSGCDQRLRRELDEVVRTLGYLPEQPRDSAEAGGCGHQFYRASHGASYLTVEYDPQRQLTRVEAADYYDYAFLSGAERLRLALREALIQRGYFPLEGGVVMQQPPTAYSRLLIAPAPDADPLTAIYAYDFRRLAYRIDDILAGMGFTAVAYPDCGNNAFSPPERICAQYLAGQGGAEGVAALTSVSLVGYMRPEQPPIELSVLQFGSDAPFAAPLLARRLQRELQQTIPELTITVVTPPGSTPPAQ